MQEINIYYEKIRSNQFIFMIGVNQYKSRNSFTDGLKYENRSRIQNRNDECIFEVHT